MRSWGALVALAMIPVAAARPASAESASYVAIAPVRVLDTRSTSPPAPSRSVEIPIGPAPVDADGVVINLTVTEPIGAGFATAYPCGVEPPLASNLNFTAGQTVPNLIIARPGRDGHVCVVTNVRAHIVADLQGWFPPGSYEASPVPTRLLDTRVPPSTVLPAPKVAAGAEMVLVSDGTGASEVINVTVTEPEAAGYVTVYPCGEIRPTTSNLNFVRGQTIANLVVARSGQQPERRVCAVSTARTHLVVDRQGALGGPGFTPITPVRMADTRSPIGVDSAVRVTRGTVTALGFPVMSGIPDNAVAVIVNVTATGATAAGYLTVAPCGVPTPATSNVNVVAGETRPNLVVTRVGAGGTICLSTNVSMHVVVDLQGWFVDGGLPLPASAPARLHTDRGAMSRLGYIAYLPRGYATSVGRTWPTIVFLHGSGQAGNGIGAELDDVEATGLPRLWRTGQVPGPATGFVVLIPQIPDDWHHPDRLRAWLAETLPRYGVDRDRLYLTGLSLGAYGAYDYLSTFGDGNEFAAMVPVAGEARGELDCAKWRRTPLWAFHGEADDVVDVEGSISAVLGANDACNPVERLKLTTYPGVGHDSWDLTYGLGGMLPGVASPRYDPFDVDIYTWMLRHVRSRTR